MSRFIFCKSVCACPCVRASMRVRLYARACVCKRAREIACTQSDWRTQKQKVIREMSGLRSGFLSLRFLAESQVVIVKNRVK